MNNGNISNDYPLKCGLAIKILSTISVVCLALSCIRYFVFYEYVWHPEGSYRLVFEFQPIYLVSLLFRIAPPTIFAIYVFRFHKKLKANFMILLVFLVYICGSVIWNSNFLTTYSFNIFPFFYWGPWISISFLRISILSVLPTAILMCTPIVSAYNGFHKKIPFVISMVVILLIDFIGILFSRIAVLISMKLTIYSFVIIMAYIGETALFTALLIFGATNRIPAIRKSKKSINRSGLAPEKELLELKDSLNFGVITEEEYNARRAEIISKL